MNRLAREPAGAAGRTSTTRHIHTGNMNALIRWNPFHELADVHGRLSSILSRSQDGTSVPSEPVATPDWSPVVDVAENDGGYLLRVEIPGVREDAVSVRLEGRSLSIRGERKPGLGDDVRYLRMERAYGTFSRTFLLPENVDAESVEARFKLGVLEIHIAKSEASKPRLIEVKGET
ncbi:Hsp20/alpha crystallin family protein [Luteolibacter sp. SL250]|uniref:Hsp20/alpha crystallin family protein n=1 Tax=Luteolibacter sp. SL250 TaxID=2995170 RepID=UPI00227171F4|nr:Hsp20/alpha crystallin family protein [Luteolibacter sp. SL250]WAC20908.1 Hsp20/alpha crystallin family protein [Luteolibacter sp. SL250]